MPTAPEVYARVREAARLADDAEAARVTRQVLHSLARVLPPDISERLARCLPAEVSRELSTGPGYDPLVDRQVFIGSLVNSLDTEYGYDGSLGGLDLSSVYADDDASLQVRAVFAALAPCLDSEALEAIERNLPPEIADWWREALKGHAGVRAG
ncbi:MAG TPA: DUF2267 domain-containing protein [Bacillota bacterium]